MTINYDEKGKFFTNIIPKEAVGAKIQSTSHLIEGEIHIRRERRLKDDLDLEEPYLAVTNASIFNAEHVLLFRTKFIAVRHDQVVWITTTKDIEVEDRPC
jgi:hypothetical protein